MQIGARVSLRMHGTQLGVSPVLRTRLGVRSVLRTPWTQGTQKRRRLSLDATPAHLTQGLFLLMILTYGCDLFSPNATMQDKMTVFWNKVMRWITNCFSSTPVPILACEACLPPLFSLLPHRRRMVALRLACAPPEINPAASRLPPSFPSTSSHRAPDSNRFLMVGLKGNYIPL